VNEIQSLRREIESESRESATRLTNSGTNDSLPLSLKAALKDERSTKQLSLLLSFKLRGADGWAMGCRELS
jgi:hypothetical protein